MTAGAPRAILALVRLLRKVSPFAGGMAPHLTPFEVGQIKAHAYHGLGAAAIAPLIVRSDKSHPSLQNVVDVLHKLREKPAWRGERAKGSGRQRKTTRKLDKEIVRIVLRHRGENKVTVAFVRRQQLRTHPDSQRTPSKHQSCEFLS